MSNPISYSSTGCHDITPQGVQHAIANTINNYGLIGGGTLQKQVPTVDDESDTSVPVLNLLEQYQTSQICANTGLFQTPYLWNVQDVITNPGQPTNFCRLGTSNTGNGIVTAIAPHGTNFIRQGCSWNAVGTMGYSGYNNAVEWATFHSYIKISIPGQPSDSCLIKPGTIPAALIENSQPYNNVPSIAFGYDGNFVAGQSAFDPSGAIMRATLWGWSIQMRKLRQSGPLIMGRRPW